jgi:copper resistance protein D
LLSLFGASLFRCLIAPDPADPVLRRCSALSLIAALGSGAVWFAMEAVSIGDAHSPAETLVLLWPVASDTRFGQVVVARFGLLLAAAVLLGLERGQPWAAAAAAGLALALQASLGHAAAMGGSLGTVLLMTETLHLLAAGAWLGGLVPLLLVLRAAPRHEAAAAARRFAPLGLSCVVVLAATAAAQGFELVGGLAGLIGTAYGWTILIKLALFLALLAIAAVNRFQLTGALETGRAEQARRRMIGTVGAETFLGLLVVIAAGFLASLPPGMHEQQDAAFAPPPSLVARK